MKLCTSMDIAEMKLRADEESFTRSAMEAKKTLTMIQDDARKKHESAMGTIDKLKEKCQNQFARQDSIYQNYEELGVNRLYNQSEKVYNKYNQTERKSRDLRNRTTLTVDDHRQRNMDRFATRDQALRKASDARNDFLKSESRRHNSKIDARDRILHNISVDQAQRSELRKLRLADTASNIGRERKKKQEFQDFCLKKEFMKNAFNQEASQTVNQMLNTSKMFNNSVELDAVHQNRPIQALKMKKPD